MAVRPLESEPVAPRPRRRPWSFVVVVAAALLASLAVACTGDDGETTGSTTTTAAPTSTEVAAAPITIMPLGDSLTEGGDPTQPTTSPQSYRGYLYEMLVDAGYAVDFVGSNHTEAIGGGDPDNEGHGGYTIGPDESTNCEGCGPANLDSGLEGWLGAAHPDVILLMIGVNDLLPSDTRPTVPAEAGAKLKALVGRIRTLEPGATVVVASYPPTSYLIDPSLDSVAAFTALNDAARQLGSGSDDHIAYAPMFETFEGSWTNDDVLGTADQLHPSATGAKRIAAVWFEALQPVLDARRTTG